MDVGRRLLRRVRGRPRPPRHADLLLREPVPPPCPPGWLTGPPDFVGVGAQKAGTTWWFHLIAAHPRVHQDPGQRPELHFFDRFVDAWPTRADIERYHALFPRPPGGLAGEKTPEYMADYWVPRMLRQAAPDARLIVLLRDPLERYLSARTQGRRRDWPNERRTIGDAFQRGRYADQLRRLRSCFPTDRILVLQYERCVRDPAGELERTHRFLGLPPEPLPDGDLRRPRNVTHTEKVELDAERRALLVELYEDEIRDLVGLVPDLDVRLWPNFAHLA
jgi:hypothetical protein